MVPKRKLLILYDWFYPGFRAGGPIQSLVNLCIVLAGEMDIFVVTGASDANLIENYPGINVDRWNDVRLPGTTARVKVYYARKRSFGRRGFTSLVLQIGPDVVYLNGIYSYHYFLLPLLAMKKMKEGFRIVICPRGMLKKGALQGKTFKKRLYLGFLRLSGLLRNASWHATTPEEAGEIEQHFPHNRGIKIAANIPKRPWSDIIAPTKQKGELKLVYLSLINEHKNLLLLLQLLAHNNNPRVHLDIWGPIADARYWSSCETVLARLGDRAKYKGEIEPHRVQEILSGYHSVILLTKGENFSHALYEGLSVGRPVVTSYFTPWQDLYRLSAGINLDVQNMQDCLQKLALLVEMENDQYERFCKGAHALAATYYSNIQPVEKYSELFGVE